MNIRLIAPLSLVIASIGFVVTHFLPGSLFIGILRAFFEAAMVGGLADWFAVVALFKRPLGLPIPHTAIIPSNRAKIEQSIVGMVNTLLPPETIIAQVSRLDIIGIFIHFWGDQITDGKKNKNREWLARQVASTIQGILSRMDAKRTAELLQEHGAGAIKAWAPKISTKISIYLAAAANHEGTDSFKNRLCNGCIQFLAKFVYSEDAKQRLEKSLEGLLKSSFLTKFLNSTKIYSADTLADQIVSYLKKQLELEKKGEPNTLRDGYKEIYNSITRELNNPQSTASVKLDQWWADTLESEEIRNFLQKHLDRYLEDVRYGHYDSRIKDYVERTIDSGVSHLKDDGDARIKVTNWLNRQITNIILANHGHISRMVTNTLQKNFPNEKLVAWIEDKVGADLQYIRLNGAVVGGLVGVAIFLVNSAIK